MRTIKLLLCGAIVNLFAYSAFAQLSDRVNNPSQFKTGTRPIAGNMGFYLGVSSEDVKGWTGKDSTESDGDTSKSILPLVNLKFYLQDNLVFRVGVKSSKEKTVLKGTIDTTNTNGQYPVFGEYSSVKSTSEVYFSPAIEKHFLNSNLMDAYIVLTLPIGYIKEKQVADSNFFGMDVNLNKTNDFVNTRMTKFSLAYGLEGHIGLQAFIADLPLALGFELGVSGIGYKGKRYKHEDVRSINGTKTEQTYYTSSKDGESYKYKELKSNSFETNGSARLTLSYYFNK